MVEWCFCKAFVWVRFPVLPKKSLRGGMVDTSHLKCDFVKKYRFESDRRYEIQFTLISIKTCKSKKQENSFFSDIRNVRAKKVREELILNA